MRVYADITRRLQPFDGAATTLEPLLCPGFEPTQSKLAMMELGNKVARYF